MKIEDTSPYWFAKPDWGFGYYPVSPMGWVMSYAFLTGFLAIVGVAVAVKNMIADPPWLWIPLLGVAALDLVVATFFVRAKTDPVRTISDYRNAK